jgi:hypothetical protein
MLCQLSTVKARLGFDDFDVKYDVLLTNAIAAISSRFDKETNRTLSRTVNVTFEFCAVDMEICVPCYPIEAISKFETKSSESEGWFEQTGIDFLIRRSCIISLSSPLCHSLSTINPRPSTCRLTFTGGYVLPGNTPGPGQNPLPPDLEQAAVEQVAFWFQIRDKLGLKTRWPHGGTYEGFLPLDLLPNVQTILKRYERYTL